MGGEKKETGNRQWIYIKYPYNVGFYQTCFMCISLSLSHTQKKKKKSELIPLINSQMFERTNNGRNCPVNDNRS